MRHSRVIAAASPDAAAVLPNLRVLESTSRGSYMTERVELRFPNGGRRVCERLHSSHSASVIVAAMLDPNTVLLVREYAVGTHRYEIALPKGRVDPGESLLYAANRELREEVGFGARSLTYVRALTLAPACMSSKIHLVLAEDLFPAPLAGDEPEPLDVVPWQLDQLHELAQRDDCSEGRTFAALFLVRELLARRPPQISVLT